MNYMARFRFILKAYTKDPFSSIRVHIPVRISCSICAGYFNSILTYRQIDKGKYYISNFILIGRSKYNDEITNMIMND